MLEGKTTSTWEKINGVRYFKIPECDDIDQSLTSEPFKIHNSKSFHKGLLFIFAIMCGILLLVSLVDPDEALQVLSEMFSESPFWFVALLSIFIYTPISMIFGLLDKRPNLILTDTYIKSKKTYLRWGMVKNMFIKRTRVRYGDEICLVIETIGGFTEIFNLWGLEGTPEQIAATIGRYYSSYRMKYDNGK